MSYKLRKNKTPLFSEDEQRKCVAALDAADRFFRTHEKTLVAKSTPAEHAEALEHVFSFRTYVTLLSASADATLLRTDITPEEGRAMGKKIYTEGDRARFQIFQTLLSTRYANQKCLLWMHNWHAAKDATKIEMKSSIPTGTISLGTRLAEKFGKQLMTIGTIVPCPGCEAAPPADAIDKAFQQVFGDKPAFVDLRRGTPPAQLPLSSAGSVPSNANKERLERVVLRDQFDAVYYLPGSGIVGR